MKLIKFSDPIINTNEVIKYTKKVLLKNFPNEGEFNQIFQKKIKSILKTHKNIIIVTEGGKKQTQKNKWASDQFVAQLNWENNSNS